MLAVADGAGSRSGTSAFGAHAAVSSVLKAAAKRAFARAYAAEPVRATAGLIDGAREAVADEAKRLQLGPDALATTLVVAVLGDENVTVAQIGDGIAVIEDKDGTISSVAVADSFEYANEAVFITSRDAESHVKTYSSESPLRSVALSTDGLKYRVLELPAKTPFEHFFRQSWKYARLGTSTAASIEEFLEGLGDAQTGDDKTLVLAVRGAETPGSSRGSSARPQPMLDGHERVVHSTIEDPQVKLQPPAARTSDPGARPVSPVLGDAGDVSQQAAALAHGSRRSDLFRRRGRKHRLPRRWQRR